MTATAVDVYKVGIEVDGHPHFVAPPRWHDEAPWKERLRRPLVDGRPEPPLIPRTIGIEGARRPAANFQAINFGQDAAVDPVGRDFLQGELGDSVAFHPLPPDADGRWLAQVTAVVDCLDEDRSDWRGEKVRSTVFRYALHADVLAAMDVDVFVLPQFAYSSWLCTRRFVDRYTAAGLSGLTFDRLLRMPDP